MAANINNQVAAVSRDYFAVASSGSPHIRIYSIQAKEAAHVLQLAASTPPSQQDLQLRCTALAFAWCPLTHSYEDDPTAWDLDGRFLWCGQSDGDLRIVDLFTGQWVERRGNAHSHPVTFLRPFVAY